MPDLQFAMFKNFKGKTTLLIWGGSDGIAALCSAFGELANGTRRSLLLHQAAWAEALHDEMVYLNVSDRDDGGISVKETERGVTVHCSCSRSLFRDFADVAAVLNSTSGSGHQYLDIAFDQPLQIILSKGEYPRDFSHEAPPD